MRKPLLAVASLAVLLPGVASAQALSCAVPTNPPRPKHDGPTADQPQRDIPIGSYTLALTWSPEYCSGKQSSARDGFQCGSANRFGFTLHGLWPDGHGKQWPQYCRPARILSPKVIRDNLCATPSAQLIQHEWAKHGTCMTTRPQRYFADARRLYAGIRYPDMAVLARRPSITAGQFASAFAAANRGVSADMMRITATRGGYLDEVWLCLDQRMKPHACPAHQGGLPAGAKLRIRAIG
ncbi:ribonuclease T2 family protein [Sphingomonas cavernae]|uniref:Ribonuclease T n=1 Tax=Sphingomonas cavernae TaxID=2320861 RepID=A0A418W6L0_9SPHN|nr:ribonuclease T [Sphingomonas cavernae]RJF85598.1 ribonuclease T [Sphingomonas cavernae]